MQIFEKKIGEPINISKAILKTNFACSLRENCISEEFNRTIMYQEVFTDGTILKKEEETKNISKINIGNKEYYATELNTREIYLNNYNYIIIYTFANEGIRVGNLIGFFDILRDVKVYVKDLNDKKALKDVKKIIRSIEKKYLLTTKNALTVFTKDYCIKEKKIDANVYQINKLK